MLYCFYYSKVRFAKCVLFAILVCSWKDFLHLSQISQNSRICRSIFVEMRIWENNWQKSDDLLILQMQRCQLKMEDCTLQWAHMLAMWRRRRVFLVKSKTSQAETVSKHHKNIAAWHDTAAAGRWRPHMRREPMRGSWTNKQTTEVPLWLTGRFESSNYPVRAFCTIICYIWYGHVTRLTQILCKFYY